MRITALSHAIRQVAPMESALCLMVSLITVLSIAQVIGPSHGFRAGFIALAMAGPDDRLASPADHNTAQPPWQYSLD